MSKNKYGLVYDRNFSSSKTSSDLNAFRITDL